ncbi:MAG: type VI secretion system protein TssL, long form, partial [Gammaproteobacteria bacterium]
VVLSHSWGNESVWATSNLLSSFHNEVAGGETFFRLLETLGQDPRGNLYLLELMYVLLSLGFEGRYRMQPNGRNALEDIRERLYRVLRAQRGDQDRELSPRWRGIEDRRNPLIRHVPLWVVAAVGALALMGVFTYFSFSLHAQSDPVAFRLHDTGAQAMPVQRKEPTPLPPLPPIDLPTLLKEEISAGLLQLENRGSHTAIVIQGDNLFRSGRADVGESVRPLLDRIADAVNQVPGDVLVTGHSDNVPIKRSLRFPSNFVLSQARAEGVVKILAAGLDRPGRLSAEGRADTEPVAPNDTRANRARNRRVEILVANGV